MSGVDKVYAAHATNVALRAMRAPRRVVRYRILRAQREATSEEKVAECAKGCSSFAVNLAVGRHLHRFNGYPIHVAVAACTASVYAEVSTVYRGTTMFADATLGRVDTGAFLITVRCLPGKSVTFTASYNRKDRVVEIAKHMPLSLDNLHRVIDAIEKERNS